MCPWANQQACSPLLALLPHLLTVQKLALLTNIPLLRVLAVLQDGQQGQHNKPVLVVFLAM